MPIDRGRGGRAATGLGAAGLEATGGLDAAGLGAAGVVARRIFCAGDFRALGAAVFRGLAALAAVRRTGFARRAAFRIVLATGRLRAEAFLRLVRLAARRGARDLRAALPALRRLAGRDEDERVAAFFERRRATGFRLAMMSSPGVLVDLGS